MADKKDPIKKVKTGFNPEKYIEIEPDFYDDFNKKIKEALDSKVKEILTDEEADELDEARAPLTLQQRRQRSLTMRRYKAKISMARERAARRKASPEKLQSRAKRKALNIIRKRFARQKSYADMTPAEKIAIDKRVSKVSQNVLNRIARKELPNIRAAEVERISNRNSQKKESVDEIFSRYLEENQYRAMIDRANKMKDSAFAALDDIEEEEGAELPDGFKKKFHHALKSDKSVNHDKRYKFNNGHSINNPAKLKEAVDVFVEDVDAMLKRKASETGVSFALLKKVFDKGAAAWNDTKKPGTNSIQWGMGRVNAYLKGDKTLAEVTLDNALHDTSSGSQSLNIAMALYKMQVYLHEIEDVTPEDIEMAATKVKKHWRILSTVDELVTEYTAKFFGQPRGIGTKTLARTYRDATPGQQDSDVAIEFSDIDEAFEKRFDK